MGARKRGLLPLRRLETAAAVAMTGAGVLWHFAYGWSGDNRAVAAIAPANESVWEHLKLVLIPVTAVAAVEALWVADRRRFWWAKVVEVVVASGFIVAFFYTYTGALGVDSIVVVDILSYVAAIAGGQWLSYRIATSPTAWSAPLRVSAAVLTLLVVSFGILTFAPPHVPLFRDAGTGTYGPA